MIQEIRTIEETKALHICFPAIPENVGGVRKSVAEFTRRQEFAPDDIDAIMLAVGEACSNAVTYGGRGFTAPKVDISCSVISAGQIQIDVRNQGNSFHPDMEEATTLPDDFATHGRGFALMCALVDDVQVLSDGHNTIVRLTKSKSVS